RHPSSDRDWSSHVALPIYIFVAFSTANSGAARDSGLQSLVMLPNEQINPVYEATRQATEEAIVNAMVAAETMTGANDVRVFALRSEERRVVSEWRASWHRW